MAKILRIIFVTLAISIGLPLCLWLAGFVVFTVTIYTMSEPTPPQEVDAAIVLTGGSNRISQGFDLLAKSKTKNLLVSGVHKDVRKADLLRDYTPQLPDCCITLGYEAGNTIGNAIEAREWLDKNKANSVYLITATYHMPRALLEFHHTLTGIKVIPYPVTPEGFSPDQDIFWKTSFVEYHKTMMSVVRILAYPRETNPLPPEILE